MTLNKKADEVLWVEAYRPSTIEETILPQKTKDVFKKFVSDDSMPNLLLTGGPGMGKTTIAKAMLNELGCDYIVKNGSLNVNIDTLRYEISTFASSVSFTGGRKYVILDEADYLNAATVQPALRNFIEEYSKNCGFIFTCNFKNRIIEPLRSRLYEVDFSIEKHFPDFRRVLTELQTYAASGRIDEGIFTNLKEESIDQLFVMLKEKNFTAMRKWCADNSDQDTNEMFRHIYDVATNKVELKSLPGFIVTLADYMYKAHFVADAEINMIAFLTEVMFETSYK